MHYVCIENSQVISILNYQPNVPASVQTVAISDEQYNLITKEHTHYFDTVTLGVQPLADQALQNAEAIKKQQATNAEMRSFLANSDWKVLRHVRELALGKPTSLTPAEYLVLEAARENAANLIQPIKK